MDNYAIADNFSLLAKLMDIHGDNSFKAKSYSSAAFTIEKLTSPLSELPADKIFSIRGIGDAIGKKIVEQLETGQLTILNEYLAKTPPGILEMLGIKGIGPKKIATIWKELEIETLGELLYACNENRLTLYKGFGEKTQKNIKESIEFYMGNQGSYLYAEVIQHAERTQQLLERAFPDDQWILTGDLRRQLETIDKLEWVTTTSAEKIIQRLENTRTQDITVTTIGSKEIDRTVNEQHFEILHSSPELLEISAKGTAHNILFRFHLSTKESFYSNLFRTSCSPEFLEAWTKEHSLAPLFESEEAIFAAAGIQPIPAFLREDASRIAEAKQRQLPQVIQPEDIKGIIHCHSNWSDGVHTLEFMAQSAKSQNLQYLVISDHSKTAFYANGLNEERIAAQHKQVDELNARLAPFRIYKSIESDILNDGSLDYADEILASFDLVIASIHSNLKMTEEKAMMRLLKAIENPYTSILGHMTGRLLLSRNGYPVDHKKIIDACAANDVVIELNAHPRRLDIDWRWIGYALERNVLISIDPDAHAIEGFADCRYGVLVAQKAGLTPQQNLSSFSLEAFDTFVQKQQQKRK
ncbi:MAG: helix-hairpin-helix domain-containing protein [Bacteroidota bacterium]|nr:helix-hairpin-helix domain-containing protein [Bacteroidota bacterium]